MTREFLKYLITGTGRFRLFHSETGRFRLSHAGIRRFRLSPDPVASRAYNTSNDLGIATSPAVALHACTLHRWRIITVLAGVLLMLAACSERAEDNRPVVSVSILPQKYLVERIAGDNFRVNVLVPPGAGPETYEPTPGQMRDVANSLLYFSIGYIDFERTILHNLLTRNAGPLIIDTSEGMDLIASEIVDHGDHVHLYGVDPHIWLSVPGAKIQALTITGALIGVDPDNSGFYLENYHEFAGELDSLHESFAEMFAGTKRKSFLVFHPALGYFARDYGLEQIAVEQDGKSPTAANMRYIVDLARKEGIRDIFIQMEFERDNAFAVARELGGDVIEINPLSDNWRGAIEDLANKLHEVLNK